MARSVGAMSTKGYSQRSHSTPTNTTAPDLAALWDTLREFRDGVTGYRPRTQTPKPHDLKATILTLLAEEPRHGAQIIRDIAQQSTDGWAPDATEVYPMLQLLVDEGLAIVVEEEGRRTYSLSEAGRVEAAPLNDEDAEDAPPWGRSGNQPWAQHWSELMGRYASDRSELPKAAVKLSHAVRQMALSGDDAQRARVATLLDDTRRRIYGILAEDSDAESTGDATEVADVADVTKE